MGKQGSVLGKIFDILFAIYILSVIIKEHTDIPILKIVCVYAGEPGDSTDRSVRE